MLPRALNSFRTRNTFQGCSGVSRKLASTVYTLWGYMRRCLNRPPQSELPPTAPGDLTFQPSAALTRTLNTSSRSNCRTPNSLPRRTGSMYREKKPHHHHALPRRQGENA